MKNPLRWLALALDKEILKLAALPYALPFIALVLSLLPGLGWLEALWLLLFLPALGFHGLLTLYAANKVTEMEAERASDRLDAHSDLERLQEALESGFTSIKSAEGLKALRELVYEHAQLHPILERRKETDLLSVAHIPALAEETYRQGLSVLEDALDLSLAVHTPERERLESEIRELEREIEALRGFSTEATRLRIREERLASHKERLEMVREQQLRVEELLQQSDRCGASLHRARMELAALKADSSEGSVSVVTETLRRTISHAKGVQEELKKLGA
jgi:hypothetical protein